MPLTVKCYFVTSPNELWNFDIDFNISFFFSSDSFHLGQTKALKRALFLYKNLLLLCLFYITGMPRNESEP